MTNENRAFVHLSDGGHFENLGVYELVRRRCRYIVVVDGGTDRTAASDNMAAMLMLVRTDFGVRIETGRRPGCNSRGRTAGASGTAPSGGSVTTRWTSRRCPACCVYLQATLTGDEPPDVLQYAARNPDFPHQSTLDQFFDEAQFECYRALGHHTAMQVFGEAASRWTGRARNLRQHQAEVQAVFAHVREQWFPPPNCSETEVIAAGEIAFALEQHIADSAKLLDYNFKLYPEVRTISQPPPDGTRDVQEFRSVSQTLQVMEAAFRAMKLARFYAHPENRGWMGAFRRWTSTEAFHVYWPFLRAEYSKQFVTFCENILNLLPPRVIVTRAANAGAVPAALLADLDRTFGQDWDDQLDRMGMPAAFAGTRIVSDVVARAQDRLLGAAVLVVHLPGERRDELPFALLLRDHLRGRHRPAAHLAAGVAHGRHRRGGRILRLAEGAVSLHGGGDGSRGPDRPGGRDGVRLRHPGQPAAPAHGVLPAARSGAGRAAGAGAVDELLFRPGVPAHPAGGHRRRRQVRRAEARVERVT